ncbi:hypothetical protein EYF80_025715 [Liparis tanakae]|uniref:Uncharacterized protein n=1 Tax=Liparis tanakae TaxID=230148 RepID=A0A4Z2HE02_9TELE|nr:hypothetical protein EYF80_025715 [Liparis tanakae]
MKSSLENPKASVNVYATGALHQLVRAGQSSEVGKSASSAPGMRDYPRGYLAASKQFGDLFDHDVHRFRLRALTNDTRKCPSPRLWTPAQQSKTTRGWS